MLELVRTALSALVEGRMPPIRLSGTGRGEAAQAYADGHVVREPPLPYPIVYYPYREGCFFLFAERVWHRPVLCSCALPALYHLVRLHQLNAGNAEVLRCVRRTVSRWRPGVGHRPGLCHRCNKLQPKLRHATGTGRFQQFHRWYIELLFLERGILPGAGHAFLEDVCPEESRRAIEEFRLALDAQASLQQEWLRHLPFSLKDNPTLARKQTAVLRQTERAHRALQRPFENEVRVAFGVHKVGEAWRGENELARLVMALFPERQVIRHYRSAWLNPLELDVFVPELRLAFEYQGAQHYKVVAHWGGAEGLEARRQNDQEKRRRCQRKGVILITIDSTVKLTKEYLVARLVEANAPILSEIPWNL